MNFFKRIGRTFENFYHSGIQKKIFTRKNFIIAGIIVSVIIALIIVGKVFIFGKKKAKVDTRLPIVKVAKVKKQKLAETYSVLGTIRGVTENDLKFEIEGTLLKFNYNEGTQISKGSVVCYLDPRDAQSKSQYAKSKFNSERSTFFSAQQRMKVYEDLFKMKAIAETKYDEARYEVESARERMEASRSEFELAQSNLAKTNIYAPTRGIMSEKLIQPGEFVTPHDVVAKFVDAGNVNLEADIPEKDFTKLKIGMKTKITCDAYLDIVFEGKLSEISPIVDQRTRTSKAKIVIDNTAGKFRSGMFARGDIYIIEMDDAITVPQDSVISLGADTKLVALLKADPFVPGKGLVELRTVVIGNTVGKNVVIKDGLMPDEMAIIETQAQLSDGLPVQYTILDEQTQ